MLNRQRKSTKSKKSTWPKKIDRYYKGDLKGKLFTFWGVAFKPNTDDVREAPAISMAQYLCAHGATVHFYDPVASSNFFKVMEAGKETKGKTKVFDDKFEAINGSHGLVIMTEWREFRFPDFEDIRPRMKKAVVFDARNIYNPQYIVDEDFDYVGIGKVVPTHKSAKEF